MQKIIAANWKMYKTRAEARSTAEDLAKASAYCLPRERQVLVFPPFTAIADVAEAFAGKARLAVGGQNMHVEKEGAFTGEVSARMLLDAGASWVLTGHSERRHIMGESAALVGAKSSSALAQGLKVMLCIGETLEERDAGRLTEVLAMQLRAGLAGLEAENLSGRMAFAYEPVWAIGTGKTAGPAEVLEAHAVTRALLGDILRNGAEALPILYGGSVKPTNAGELLQLDNVDGLLVGGASLEAQSFAQIIEA